MAQQMYVMVYLLLNLHKNNAIIEWENFLPKLLNRGFPALLHVDHVALISQMPLGQYRPVKKLRLFCQHEASQINYGKTKIIALGRHSKNIIGLSMQPN